MSWISEYRNVWRVAILVIVLFAIMGPWTFDRIWVPSGYACSSPNVRLYGDFCGVPLSGTWVLGLMVSVFVSASRGLVGGKTTQPRMMRRCAHATPLVRH
jgi:hypothetical protein